MAWNKSTINYLCENLRENLRKSARKKKSHFSQSLADEDAELRRNLINEKT